MTVLLEPSADDIPCDVCIVGTGPVGIALALECERLGLTVLALEAGGKTDLRYDRKDEAEILDPARHAPMHVTTRRAFGGTSWAWSGCCTPFDDIDFEVRKHVSKSGWPLKHSEIVPHYERAAGILNCRMHEPLATEKSWRGLDGVAAENLLHWSEQPKLAESYWQHFSKSKAITVCLNSPVIALDLGAEGKRVEAVTVRSRGRTVTFRPPRVVLAGGGLRTTQLLLATQRHWPGHFGGSDGALGRYYMGHLTGWISSIRFRDPAEAQFFSPRVVNGAYTVRRRLTLPHGVQSAEHLLNIAFWPAAHALYDPAHADGTLSAAFLALAVPGLGAWLLPGPVRRAALGPKPRRFMPHVRNAMRTPRETALGAARAVMNRIMSRPAIDYWPRPAGSPAFLLQYHAESGPNRESHVTLGDRTDSLGLPRLQIDLRFSDEDARSTVRAHDMLDRALRSAGRAELEYLDPPEERIARVLEQATDGYHQLGTTRMGTDPKQSVVDRDCKVHGVENLHVASGSVFPTSGHANPTLLTAALAVRLAGHLATSAPK